MTSRERILLKLVYHTLEYGLRNNIEYLVLNIANNLKPRFSNYGINSIRFELFNLFYVTKYQQYNRFDTVIRFLYEFQTNFPNIVPNFLFIYVAFSLKTLHILDLLRNGKIELCNQALKKYFPISSSFAINSVNQKEKVTSGKSKPDLEFKITNLRHRCREFMLDEKKRIAYFQNQFLKEFDSNSYQHLIASVTKIIELINANLPLTVIDKLLENNFQDSLVHLLGEKPDETVEFEDDMRIELFLDNFKLQKMLMTTEMNEGKKNSNVYFRKIISLFYKWQLNLNIDLWSSDMSSNMSNATQPQTQVHSNNNMIHEILYLDMELESYNQQDQQEVTDLGVSIPNNNHDQRESDDSGVKFARTLDPISILTEDNTTSGISTNSTVYTTALSCLKDNLSVNTSNSKSVMARESFPNDILTDDEKENER